jgi:DNA primase
LVVVEGFLDALVATARGVLGVVATGGSALTDSQLETVLRYGERSFVLALDSDEAGQKGTEQSLERMYGRKARAYVLTLPEGLKDPDELIKAKGVEAFRALVSRAEAGAKWKAKRLLSKHSLQTDRDRCLTSKPLGQFGLEKEWMV